MNTIGTKINAQFKAPKTLGEFRALAIDILKNHTHIPDRGTIFINGGGTMNVNWYSVEDQIKRADELKAKLLKERIAEAEELRTRLLELEELGL